MGGEIRSSDSAPKVGALATKAMVWMSAQPPRPRLDVGARDCRRGVVGLFRCRSCCSRTLAAK